MSAPTKRKSSCPIVGPIVSGASCVGEDSLGELNVREIAAILSNAESVVDFCFQKNLLRHEMWCSREGCGHRMVLEAMARSMNGKIWRCHSKLCGHTRSITYGSVFYHAKLPISTILSVLYLFANNISPLLISQMMRRMLAEKGVLNLLEHFRGYISRKLKRDPLVFHGSVDLTSEDQFLEVESEEADGPSVEMDESLSGKKKKGAKGKEYPRYSVFGIVERSGRRCVLQLVSNRKTETLLPIIEAHVSKNCKIFTDCFSSYACLASKGFAHSVVNHSERLVEPDGTHSNTAEGTFGLLKQAIGSAHGVTGYVRLAAFLDEFQFRRWYEDEEDGSIWKELLAVIAEETVKELNVAEYVAVQQDDSDETDD